MNKVLVVAEWSPNFLEHFTPLITELRNHHGEIHVDGLLYLANNAHDHVNSTEIPANPFNSLSCVFGENELKSALSRNDYYLATYVFIKPSSSFLSGSSGDIELYRISANKLPNAIFVLRTISSLKKTIETESPQHSDISDYLLRLKKRESNITIKVHLLYYLWLVMSVLLRIFALLKTPTRQHKILFIRLDALGDMVLSLPALLTLREHFPNSEITLLVSRRSGAIIEEQQLLNPGKFCDRLLYWEAPWNEDKENLQGIKAFLRLLLSSSIFLREKYDVVLQPVELGTGVLFATLFNGDLTVASIAERLPLARFIEKHVRPVKFLFYQQHHIADLPNRVVTEICSSSVDKYLHNSLKISDNDIVFINQQLISFGWNGSTEIVAINLGAGHSRRKWSPENYAKLLQILSDDNSVFPILIGGPGEVELGNLIQSLLNFKTVNLVGGLSLNQLTALLSISEVVVTPDTGVMHMAAALDRKIVAIFGAGLVPFCRPLCSEYIIVKHELGCSGCNDICFTNGDAPCIALVKVDMVLVAVQTLLQRGPMKNDKDGTING